MTGATNDFPISYDWFRLRLLTTLSTKRKVKRYLHLNKDFYTVPNCELSDFRNFCYIFGNGPNVLV